MAKNEIVIKGAREHNLKNINITIPREKLVVMTGLSGSGKTSLAFDTIYAEGQRRYIESLSSYARQFLGQMEKPDVDYIEGLSPAISIDQKTTSKNPRSTVGTVTEIYDYYRLLFARAGTPHCPVCHEEISQITIEEMVDQIMNMEERTKIQILAPVVRGKKGEHQKQLEQIRKDGFVRIRVNGEIREIYEEIKLNKNKKHHIEIVVDRIVVKPGIEQRVADSLETALKFTEGLVLIDVDNEEDILYSTHLSCPEHHIGMEELSPRMFSFNNPYGACSVCKGIGHMKEVDPDLVIPDKNLSIREGAIAAWGSANGQQSEDGYYFKMIEQMAAYYHISLDKPIKDLPDNFLKALLYGSDDVIHFEFESRFGGKKQHSSIYEGVIPNLSRRYKETNSEYMRDRIESFMSESPCPSCKGARLQDISLAVTVGGFNINEITLMSVKESVDFFNKLTLSDQKMMIAKQVFKEIKNRLYFLQDVGLDYLTLARSAGTLSGGESQRIRLATQIGSSLVGVLYILDEPSIGLHQRDNAKLLKTLRNLTDLGNTVIVVEHDEDTIMNADHLVDIGPGAGIHGGQLVAQGTVKEVMETDASITGKYLKGERFIPVPDTRRKTDNECLQVLGAAANNLKNLDITLPLGLMTCVTGVSGSGKSTLVNEVLYKRMAQEFYKSREKPGRHQAIVGMEHIDKVIKVSQDPIGRTPRSNPATYTGVFDHIRDLFAQTPTAKMRGYQKGRFSFNLKGGRCEACKGDGIIKIEMHFLPDVYIPCEVCKGKRYNRETLEVKYKGKNIADVLEMNVEEALLFFESIPVIKRKLQTMMDVGLSYIQLGQPSTQLSGGEAQRIKLSTELGKKHTGKTFYVLDEPTTGLHIADVETLIIVLQRLVDAGNTVVVIEHNLEVIKTADFIIDLGPEGGAGGGELVIAGTPEEVAACKKSYTGRFLSAVLNEGRDQLKAQ
ncbi:excinuclease ABC subunit UvrA [Tindallia californiensis]|uniref:UvrABC system protein A n=1 Tax=Tindallia californiensis TaxID=159292 RepID=A0A1H3K335_9FIRM|nr:excinuclease ABC subunit UvrA [Tindallia californiensis]SDY46571.1 excinuclease ABC subunit A [Tindallia californiensis]